MADAPDARSPVIKMETERGHLPLITTWLGGVLSNSACSELVELGSRDRVEALTRKLSKAALDVAPHPSQSNSEHPLPTTQ